MPRERAPVAPSDDESSALGSDSDSGAPVTGGVDTIGNVEGLDALHRKAGPPVAPESDAARLRLQVRHRSL